MYARYRKIKRIEVMKILFSIFFGIIVGCVMTNFGFFNYQTSFLADASMLKTVVDIQQSVYVLQKIRAGDIKGGAELLEIKLDGDLIALVGIEKNKFSDLTNEAAMKSINLAGNYRNKHIRKTDSPEIDKTVCEVLSKRYSEEERGHTLNCGQ
jgi:hypothetical protein